MLQPWIHGHQMTNCHRHGNPRFIADFDKGQTAPVLFSQPGSPDLALKALLPKTMTCVLSEFSFRKWEVVHLVTASRHRGRE